MFLAAAPYFEMRFANNEKIRSSFQSTEISVSCVVNLIFTIILINIQGRFAYPKRINVSLVIFILVFTLMTLSTRLFSQVSSVGYFVFLICEIAFSSIATAFMQNGIFAYMAGFGRNEYPQGNMMGQAIAGVLPCVVQIISVLSVPEVETVEEEREQASNAALAYFSTACGVSVLTLVAWRYLRRLDKKRPELHLAARKPSNVSGGNSNADDQAPRKKRVPILTLFKKLRYPSTAVFLTFAISMFFPVYTAKIRSVHPLENIPRILSPRGAFVPLAFLVWNTGDFVGRLVSALPRVNITRRPRLLLLLSTLRAGFVPMYLLCNVNGNGAVVNSDIFYLAFVQFFFGLTNGYLGTQCMTSSNQYVDVDEREAAGSFMPLMLVAGLTVGSLLSFAIP
jgi:solute carrier family 29 (equilibrative nucleoside transporter), member 1/2/3